MVYSSLSRDSWTVTSYIEAPNTSVRNTTTVSDAVTSGFVSDLFTTSSRSVDLSSGASVSQMLKDLDLSSLENRRKMNKLTLLYKIRNGLLCIKENGYLERADSRTRHASRNYKLKSVKSELFKHSFFINTPKIWNNLPSVIKYTQSLEHFKMAVRQHYQKFW